MLEDATWARLAMAMSALKGFEEDNNMLKKSSVSRQNLSHRFVKAAAEINEGKATAADFDVDLPTGTMTFP